jgi:hypothetical protein
MYHRNISGTMIILAKTSQLFSADSLVGKSSYGSIALPTDKGLIEGTGCLEIPAQTMQRPEQVGHI